jgi:hypothetical protein
MQGKSVVKQRQLGITGREQVGEDKLSAAADLFCLKP